jgi:hypothetical protein
VLLRSGGGHRVQDLPINEGEGFPEPYAPAMGMSKPHADAISNFGPANSGGFLPGRLAAVHWPCVGTAQHGGRDQIQDDHSPKVQ